MLESYFENLTLYQQNTVILGMQGSGKTTLVKDILDRIPHVPRLIISPQNRMRIIVVGHTGNFEFPVESDKIVTSGEALKGTAHRCSSKSKFLTPSMDKYVAVYEKKSQVVTPRDLHLDKPARTVTCRNLAGATSDMHRIKLPDGRRRRLTVREGARLQSFPDWFEFIGSETDQFNQIGNAVPPLFARALAKQIMKYLRE